MKKQNPLHILTFIIWPYKKSHRNLQMTILSHHFFIWIKIMKRKFFCVLAVVGIFFFTEVFAGMYFKIWCGVEGMTVGSECFENWYLFESKYRAFLRSGREYRSIHSETW